MEEPELVCDGSLSAKRTLTKKIRRMEWLAYQWAWGRVGKEKEENGEEGGKDGRYG